MSRTDITKPRSSWPPGCAAGRWRTSRRRSSARRPDAVPALRAVALHLVLRHHARRHGHVHHRLEVSGVAMAEIRVENLQQGLRIVHRGPGFELHRRRRRVLRACSGPSGCGKTTTLRMIAGLELPTGGQILLDGEDVTMRRAARARHRLRVPAVRALSAHERAQEHRLPAARPGHAARPRSGSASRRRRGSCASTTCSTSPVSGLAGGDRQRVALGRAIVRRPKCFLMDEPLGTLDTEFRDLMVHELRELHNRIHATTVYVTHDQMEAMSMADKIAVMNHGVIEQFGTPQEIYDRPATHVRRRLHRLAADELPAVRRRPREGRAARSSFRAQPSPCRKCARTSRRAAWRSACGPSTSASTTPRSCAARSTAPNISAPRRSSRSRPRTASSRRAFPADLPVRMGETVGLALNGARLSLFEQASGRAIRTSVHDGGASWLMSRCSGVSKIVRRGRGGPRPRPAHRRRRVRRAARADRRRQDDDAAADRRAGDSPTRARSSSPAATRRRCRRRSATSPSCSSNIRSIRTCRSSTTSPSRCARRRASCRSRDQAPRSTRWRSWCASTTSSTTGRPGFGRRDAARRDRPGAGAQAGDLPDGRAAVLARRQAARRPAAGAEAHPDASSAPPCSTSPTTRSRR